MLVAEFCSPEQRHIVSVFKLLQELLTPSQVKGKNQFQLLIEQLPSDHKARWMAGAALHTSEQAMLSVLSTAMSRLNAFLDTELEQVLCFDSVIDAERFCREKTALFIVMPEENPTIGILLCADKNDAIVEMTLPQGSKRIFASKYMIVLPDKETLRLLVRKQLGGEK